MPWRYIVLNLIIDFMLLDRSVYNTQSNNKKNNNNITTYEWCYGDVAGCLDEIIQ